MKFEQRVFPRHSSSLDSFEIYPEFDAIVPVLSSERYLILPRLLIQLVELLILLSSRSPIHRSFIAHPPSVRKFNSLSRSSSFSSPLVYFARFEINLSPTRSTTSSFSRIPSQVSFIYVTRSEIREAPVFQDDDHATRQFVDAAFSTRERNARRVRAARATMLRGGTTGRNCFSQGQAAASGTQRGGHTTGEATAHVVPPYRGVCTHPGHKLREQVDAQIREGERGSFARESKSAGVGDEEGRKEGRKGERRERRGGR